MSSAENNEADFSSRIKNFNTELKSIMDKYEVGFTAVPTVASSRNSKIVDQPEKLSEPSTDKKVKIRLITPPKEAFRDTLSENTRTLGQQTLFYYERTELSEQYGIMRWFKGVPYPEKGFPYPDAIKAIGLVKRSTTIILKNISILKLLRSKKKRQQLFGDYCYMADVTLSGHYLKDEWLCPFAREVKKFLTAFLSELNYSPVFADIMSFFVQYDDNYRYRLQDVISESEAKNFTNPQRELRRLLNISLDRDTTNYITAVKFRLCVRFLNFLLHFPKMKKAFHKALEAIDFERMKFDEADRYFCLMRGDYNYFGESLETREEIFHTITPIQPKQLIF